MLQHKSTNIKQHDDERYAAYIGLAEEDNVIINRQLQNSMSISIPAEVTSWTEEEEADALTIEHSDVLWNDKPADVAWKPKEDIDCDCKDLRLKTAVIRETDDF